MISDPDLVLYACIAHRNSSDLESSTILAEFNSANSSLQQLAHQCLNLVPQYHSLFSHSFNHQSYTFLLNNGFVYFGIFDSRLFKSDQVHFLTKLKETIGFLMNRKSSNFKLSSFCFQSEIHPIFYKLISGSYDLDDLYLNLNGFHHNNNKDNTTSNPISSKNKKGLSLSLLNSAKNGKGLKKKKLSGESLTNSREALVDGDVNLYDDYDDNDISEVKSKEIYHHHQNVSSFLMDGGIIGKHKAKKIWRRHVWIVLVMDLVVCLILFGIWLFVCRGFQCIEG